jgi:hypothetical protein
MCKLRGERQMARFKLDYRRIFTLATLTLLLLSVFAPIGRIWVSADESWADPDCRYRMKLTFGNSASKENFTDFPVLVVLNSSRIDYSKTGATDIRFYDGSTLLSKETELWNASGNSYIWVKVPQIDNSNTDYIYAYYNCSGSSNLDDAASVWSSYAMVQHLEETSGTLTDSTPNHNDGTPSGVTLDTPGKIDGGDDYDGSSSYSVVNDSASLNFGTDSFSYMFWFKSRATGTQDILDKKGAAQGATNAGYKMTISSTNATGLSAALGDGTNNTRLDTGYDTSRGGNVWAMYAIVVDRIQQKMFAYINGTQRVNASISSIGSVSNTKQMYLGKEATGIAGRNYNGGLDEVRVLRMLPSADWVKAQYLSMSDQYVIYGGEESLYHPPDKPFNPNPANSATDVPISTTLSVNVTHPDGTRMDVYFYQPSVTSPPPENFTMVALPDTQIYSESYPSIFDNQTQWIADSTGNIRTVFVTHEGDVINVNSATVQWQNANHSMSKLDGHVPWGIAPGNHELDSNTTNYNTYFGYDRFVGESWYGGAYNNVNTNSYELFTGGHDDYLIFHLQYGVNDSVLAWANTTLASYPNRRVIVTAHDYMNSAGTRSTTGTLIWNDFIAPHAEQVFLVLCGHSPGEASRTDVVNGHTIYQLSADFQDRPNGGNGWLRTLEFRPTEDKIYVKTYSPYLNSYENDANSEFTLDYNMTHYTYLPPVLIGVATNVPSGGVASVTWKVLNFSTTYRWYAVAVDTLGASNQSETWNFTTSAAGCVVYIDPALVEKNLSNVGSTFDVELSIQNVVGLFGFDFNLTWNKAFITLVNAEYSSELNNVWGPGNWVVVKDEIAPGAYKLVATSTSTDFSGNHPLVKLTFRVEYCAGQRETPIHFEVHKLSDSHWTPISHAAEDGTYRIAGGRPRLDMNPATKTCRKYSETLTVKINVTNPGDAEDFRFEIHYNATLLDIAGISWTAWGSGTYNVDEINGNLTGYTSGSAISANTTLVTVIFNATYYHMWKDLPDWTNDVSSAIYLQWANLSYASASDLHYERGGLNDIDVGPDFTYTLSPIQGDIDNNGVVDIFDLRTIAAFYGTTDAQHNLTGEDIVDVYDIVVVASNFNYKYVP